MWVTCQELTADRQDSNTDKVRLLVLQRNIEKEGITTDLLPANLRLLLFVKNVNKKQVQNFHLFERPHVALRPGLDMRT
jgi:hypothetical protein